MSDHGAALLKDSKALGCGHTFGIFLQVAHVVGVNEEGGLDTFLLEYVQNGIRASAAIWSIIKR